MAIFITTKTPDTLLANIKGAIKKGRIETWQCDSDGDFTHSPNQWKNQAWLRPVIEAERLRLRIFPPMNSVMSSEVYAVYHGRFVEMLLAHFDTQFTWAYASALPTSGDVIDTTKS